MISLPQISANLCLRLALFPADKSEQKSRVTAMYECGLITSGDVERIFEMYDLGAA